MKLKSAIIFTSLALMTSAPLLAHGQEMHSYTAHTHVEQTTEHENHGMGSNTAMGDHHQHHMNNPSIHRPEMASHTAVQSGSWSDPATWANGNLPTDQATVAIPAGIAVTVDRKIPYKYKSIAIDGTLRFAPTVDTELWVDTLTSGLGSRLEVGTAEAPIMADVTARIIFADLGAIDLDEDPKQLGRGAVLGGTTIMHGAAKTHRVTVAEFPKAGATTLLLSETPQGWRVGDELIIAGSQGQKSDEVRTINGINGATVTLNAPLELDHVPPKADLNLWVANSSRNVRFESENREVLRRGHIMFRHTHDVDVQYAGFYGLGRTDKREELNDVYYEIDEEMVGNDNNAPIHFTVEQGEATNIRGRYAIHFHRGGTNPMAGSAIVNGSVVVDSPGWGFVNHSSNINFIDNVSYDVQGAGFYTEAGDEVGSMIGNIAIRTVNDAFVLDDLGAIDPDLGLDRGDFGNDGDGFWLSGNRVSVIDNVSSGASAHGFIFWTDGLIEPDTGRAAVKVDEIENGHLITNRDTIPVWWAPLAEVRNNESSNATVGFRSRYIHSANYMGDPSSEWHATPPQAYIDTLKPVFEDTTVWGSRDGMLINYNERLSVRNARLIGIGAPFQHNLGQTAALGIGLDYNNVESFGPGFIENVTIEGYEVGFLAPRQSYWTISDLHLSNVTDILIHEALREPRTMPMTDITFGSLDGTAVAGQESQRQHIVMDAEFDFPDPDPNFIVWPDTVTLDGREIFFNQQEPGYIPYGDNFEMEEMDMEGDFEEEDFGEDDEFDESELAENGEEFEPIPFTFNQGYFDKTNQQLMDEYGVALGGEVMPTDAVSDPRIVNGKMSAGVSAKPALETHQESMVLAGRSQTVNEVDFSQNMTSSDEGMDAAEDMSHEAHEDSFMNDAGETATEDDLAEQNSFMESAEWAEDSRKSAISLGLVMALVSSVGLGGLIRRRRGGGHS